MESEGVAAPVLEEPVTTVEKEGDVTVTKRSYVGHFGDDVDLQVMEEEVEEVVEEEEVIEDDDDDLLITRAEEPEQEGLIDEDAEEQRRMDAEDKKFMAEEKRLKQVYEENVDGIITELEQGNYFLGYDKVPNADKFLVDKKFVKKYKIEVADYNKYWYNDIFVLGHNTVKKEMKEMNNLVRAMEHQGLKLEKRTIIYFYEWWNLFLSVFTIVLDMEEDVIYPWIEKKVDLDGTGMDKHERAVTKKKLQGFLQTMRVQEKKMNYIPPGEVAPKVLSFLEKFNPIVVGYMSKSLNVVAPIVNANFTEEQYRKDLLPQMSKYLHEYFEWTEIVPLMTAWMPKRDIAIWKSDFLVGMERLSYNGWCKNVEKTHYELRDCITAKPVPRAIKPRNRKLQKMLDEKY